jgi:hypothetical protein
MSGATSHRMSQALQGSMCAAQPHRGGSPAHQGKEPKLAHVAHDHRDEPREVRIWHDMGRDRGSRCSLRKVILMHHR